MPYIGNTIRAADDYRLIDDISSSFNGSTTSFALQVAGSAPVPFPKSPQQVLISVNGVIQEPDPSGSSGFNLVGTNIVFSSAPTNGHAFFGIIYATADYLNAGGNFPAGSLGAPSITFIGDENTGLYRKGGGSIGFVADATEIANTDSNGLTLSSGNLILGDSGGASDDRIVLGAGSDLQIFHNGSHSYIGDYGTGTLRIEGSEIGIISADGSKTMAQFFENGAVSLRHNNGIRFETLTNGVQTTGSEFISEGTIYLEKSGVHHHRILSNDTGNDLGFQQSSDTGANTNFTTYLRIKDGGDISLPVDGKKLLFGAGNDLQIYHDGSNSYVNNTGTGLLILQGNGSQAVSIRPVSGETGIAVEPNGAAKLYHDNSKKFETSSSGATVTGNLLATGNLSVNDNNYLYLGNSGDLNLRFLNGTGAFIQSGGNTMYIRSNLIELGDNSGNKYIKCIDAGAVELYYDNSKKFETTTNGIKVNNRVEVIANAIVDNAANGNNVGILFGSSAVLPSTGAGSLANNSKDLGSSSTRWRNIYTNDLHLSNEGSSNDVDGTWGSYTIQEGAEDLFLVNKRSGKKYKFNLTEVT